MVEIVKGGSGWGLFFAMPIASIGDVGSKRVADILIKKQERRNIYRICLDEKRIIIGAILVSQVDDLWGLHRLIRGKEGAEVLNSRSIWKPPVS